MKRFARGFTLVELLTVVAIIALLISILVPAVQRARRAAKETAIKAQQYAISQGLQMFHNDFGYYPSSLPQTSAGVNAPSRTAVGTTPGNYPVTGAHRLAFALLGRDKLGCPAKTGAVGAAYSVPVGTNTQPDSISGWYYSTAENNAAAGAFNAEWVGPDDEDNWGTPACKTARKGPYVEAEGLSVVADESLNIVSGTGKDYVWLICDKYETSVDVDITAGANYQQHSAIMYFSANPRGNKIKAVGTTGEGSGAFEDANIYFWQDNQNILAGQFQDVNGSGSAPDQSDFWAFIEDPKAKIGVTCEPHNKESFLLMSRGNDGLYGTDDDIINWERQ